MSFRASSILCPKRAATVRGTAERLSVLALLGISCGPQHEASPTIASIPQAVTLTDCKASSLVGAVAQANSAPQPTVITLMAGCTYALDTANNVRMGPNALPVISTNVTIDGGAQGATIRRASGAPEMRLAYVANLMFPPNLQGQLTLRNVRVSGFVARGGNTATASFSGGGGMGAGGAILSSGATTLIGVTMDGNAAYGGMSGDSLRAGTAGLIPASGGGGMGGSSKGYGGGGFQDSTSSNGGDGINGTEGGLSNGNGGTNASGTEDGSAAMGAQGGAGGGATASIGLGVGGNGGGLSAYTPNQIGGSGGGLMNVCGGGGGAGYGGSGGRGTRSGTGVQCGGGGGYGGGGAALGGGGGVGGGGGAGSYANGTDLGGGGGGFGGGGGGTAAGIGGNSGWGGFGGGAGGFGSTTAMPRGGFGGGDSPGINYPGSTGGGGMGAGGAIFVHYGTLTVINSTLTLNRADGGTSGVNENVLNREGGYGGSGYGGAIFSLNSNVTLTNATLAGNDVHGGAGRVNGDADGSDVYALAYRNGGGTVTLRNTILANPSAGASDLVNQRLSTGTATVDVGTSGNLIADLNNQGGTITGTLTDSHDPLLGFLRQDQGPTPTLALTPGSPAIGRGVASVCNSAPVSGVDQRGLPRATCDIGAWQTQPGSTSATGDLGSTTGDMSGSDPGRGTGGGFTCSASRAGGTSAGGGPLVALLLGIGVLLGRRRVASR